MVTKFKCTCGNTDPKKTHEYDGAISYEAIVCTTCGRYYDNTQKEIQEANDFSFEFVELPQNIQALVDARKTTYRGYGAHTSDVRLKYNGIECRITSEQFTELGGIEKIRFDAPYRQHI